MSRYLGLGLLVACVAAVGLPEASHAAVIFSDDFSSSTLNGASNPTATSTSYDVASTKNQSPASSIGAGHLKYGMATTTSGVEEVQARFAATPVTLASPGDSVTFAMTFTNTQNLLGGGTSSAIYMGMYDSGGVAPATGLQSSGLTNAAASSFALGHAANWQGYVSRIVQATGSNQIYTRPLQNGVGDTSANQDLVGNNAGGGLYNNPAGTVIGGNSASTVAALTAAAAYTDVLTYTLNADGTLGITAALYGGVGTGGTQLSTESVTSAVPLSLNFDGLAFGYRQSGVTLPTGMDVNALSVTADIQSVVAPEPAMLAFLPVPAALLLRRRK